MMEPKPEKFYEIKVHYVYYMFQVPFLAWDDNQAREIGRDFEKNHVNRYQAEGAVRSRVTVNRLKIGTYSFENHTFSTETESIVWDSKG